MNLKNHYSSKIALTLPELANGASGKTLKLKI